MGVFDFIKIKKKDNVGNVEDFMSLTRVFFQSVIATHLGVTNIRALPDIANFKRVFKVQTQNGKLGVAEKAASKKMLINDYGLTDNFFKEIEQSVKRNCRNIQEIQPYLFMFQGFSNDFMMLMVNIMQWKLRIPFLPKSVLQGMTSKAVSKVCNKPVWKEDDMHKTAMMVKQYKEKLGYSEKWMVEYMFNILLLAKKESKKKKD